MRRFTRSRRGLQALLTRSRRVVSRIDWQTAPDIKERVRRILQIVHLPGIKQERLFCFRSLNAQTRAYARIWGLGRIWQQALDLPPAYVIEVISEKFDKLPQLEQDKVLLHELTHIPKNFSGSLVPHIRRGKRNFHRQVDTLISQYLRNLTVKGWWQ